MYDNKYSKERNNFINESMNKFINKTYNVRQDETNIEENYIKNSGNFWVAIDIIFNNNIKIKELAQIYIKY